VAICPTARFYELEDAAITLLTQADPRILIIDDIQHLHSCSAREQPAALNVVKFLTKNRRISVVAAGTHESFHVMRFDSHRPTIYRVCPALTDRVTGRIIDLLRRAAVDALGHRSKSVCIDELLIAGGQLRAIITQVTRIADLGVH
jgi:hypothetical protein